MKEKVLEIIEKYPTLLEKYGINTYLRKSHFFAQIYHESHLLPISENLNYSAKRLVEIFPKYFPTLESTKSYYAQPKKIASRVYANRMGNGNEASGDGYNFRGRGFTQVTGRENYTTLSKDTGIDFLSHPELLLEEANALISALWFWKKIGGNALADIDNVETITKKINGGFNGLKERKKLVEELKQLFQSKSK